MGLAGKEEREVRQNPNQKVLSFMHPGLASDWEDGRSGQACQSSDICVVRRVWPSDSAPGKPPEHLLPSVVASLSGVQASALEFRVTFRFNS